MNTCHQCNKQLTAAEMSSGRCQNCGADLPPELATSSLLASIDFSKKSMSVEVPVFTADQAHAALSSGLKPGTVDADEDFSKISAMTPESDLPVAKRSIIDADVNVAPPVGEAAPQQNDEMQPSIEPKVSKQSDARRADFKPPVEKAEHTFKTVEDRPNDARAKNASEQPVRRPKGTESQLNIHQRLLAMPGSGATQSDGQTQDPSFRPDYEIIRKLGKGGMGEVWLAHQTSLGREVALKQIRSDKVKDNTGNRSHSARRSFLAEAVVTGDLNHPNIVPVYDMGTDIDGNLLYSMKCVRGTSRDKLIESYPEADNIEILRKVGDAIAFAHNRGVVHRDLKPSNIMVGSYGEVLVMDWGTALPLAHFSKAATMSSSSGCAGTPAYMPPEQAAGDISKTGPHSDIYLLGAMLFEVIAGYPPHPMRNDSGESLTVNAVIELAKVNRIVGTDAKGELLEIALKAMRTAPRDRYPSVEKFNDALKNYQKHAESVTLATQAAIDLETANKTSDYSTYGRAVNGFENALKLWESNFDASGKLKDARKDYANAALKKEDYDLGLSLVEVEKDQPGFKKIHEKLLAGKQERDKRQARLRTMRWTAALLLLSLFAGGTGFSFYANYLRSQEQSARLAAENAKKDVEKANDDLASTNSLLAKTNVSLETEKEKVLAEKEIAIKAEMKAKDEQGKAEIAKKNADDARMLAEKKEGEAKTAEALAKREEEKAKVAEMKAKEEKEKAEAAELVAKAAAKAEKIAKNNAVREWYFAQINLADQQVAQNAFDSARDTLAKIKSRREEKGDSDELNGEGEGENSLAHQIGWEFERLNYVCELANDKLGPNVKGADNIAMTAVAAGNQLVATANLRGEIQVWTTETPRKLVQTLKSEGHPNALAFSPDSKSLAAGSTKGRITIWDLASGKPSTELSGHTDEITRLLYLPKGELVSTSRDRTARVWNVKEKTSTTLKGHTDPVLSVAYVSDQNNNAVGLVTGDANRGEIRLWKLPTGDNPQSEILLNEQFAITAIAAQLRGPNRDKLVVFAGNEAGDLNEIERPWDMPKNAKGKAPRSLVRQTSDRHQGGISGLMIDPNEKNRLISTSRDNTIRTWNIAPAALADDNQSLLQQVLRGHGNSIVDAAVWKDDGSNVSRLITASADGTARLWRPDESAEIVALGGATLVRDAGTYGEMLSVSAGGGNGEQIMGVSRDGVATIWNMSDRNPAKRGRISLVEGHRFLTQSAVFLKGTLVTTSFDGTAAVWNTQTGSMVKRLEEVGTSGVLAGSEDGRWVITGYVPAEKSEKNLQVFSLSGALKGLPPSEIQTTMAVGKSATHGNKKVPDLDTPMSAAISPNGFWGLVGTDNGYLNLIDLQAMSVGEEVGAHLGKSDRDAGVPDGVTGVAFLSDSEAVSSGLDGTLRFWVIEDGKLTKHPKRLPYTHNDGKTVHRVLGIVVSANGRRIAARLRQGRTAGSGSLKDKDFRQVWVTDIDAEGTKPFVKLEPWGTTDDSGDNVVSISMTSNGERVLATVNTLVSSDNGASKRRQTVLREWKLDAGNNPVPTPVLKSADGFDFQQAIYLPNETDRIAVLSDSLTNIRKRTDRGGFSSPAVAAYGPTVALQACGVSKDGKLAVTVSDSLIPATDQPADGENGEARLEGEIRIWKVDESFVGKRAYGLSLKGAIRTVAMSPLDQDLILVGGNQLSDDAKGGFAAGLYRWNDAQNEKTLVKIQSLGHHKSPIIRARFSNDGKRIVTASSDGQVEVFEQDKDGGFASLKLMNLGAKNATLQLSDLITADLSDDGKLLVAANRSGAVVYDVESGKPVIDQLIQGHSSDLTDVRFALRPNAKTLQRLWTTSLDGTVKFWGLPDARQPVDAGGEKTVTVARLLLTLRGHHQGVMALAALPNGGVVTAGKDGRVIIWPISQVP